MAYIRDSHYDLQRGDRLCASERVTPGRNGNYDARLIKYAARDVYLCECYMKLQFFFEDGDRSQFSSANGHRWQDAEKRGFMRIWRQQVKHHWDKTSAGRLSNNHRLDVVFLFEIQEAGWMWDHFEISVTKIPAGGFAQSSVRRQAFGSDVTLDSRDIEPKRSGQLASVHEFGHMIGNPDEYVDGSRHNHDSRSIMHGGTDGRSRHYSHIITWADRNKC